MNKDIEELRARKAEWERIGYVAEEYLLITDLVDLYDRTQQAEGGDDGD